MLNYKFRTDETYLLACTYGSDSMALLDMMQKSHINPIVCAVNYRVFSESDQDMVLLESYCKERGLVFELLDCNLLPEDKRLHKGEDWKSWARETRYAFFEAMYKKHDAKALVLAHNQDDLIESYLLSKKGEKENYGYCTISSHNDMIVVRPLIEYSKEDLLEYDEENSVPFSPHIQKHLDETTRNPIRKDVISKLNEIDRGNILTEMVSAKSEQIEMEEAMENDIHVDEELNIRSIMALPKDLFTSTIVAFVQKADENVNITPNLISQIRKFCLSPSSVDTLKLVGHTFLIKEYDILSLGNDTDDLPFTYVLEKPGKLSTEQFELDFSMGAEDRGIKESDYPLTIRTALPSDNFTFNGYLLPVRFFYAEAKMPLSIRNSWPVFCDKDGKIVYVPRYRMNFAEYHSSKLEIHIR